MNSTSKLDVHCGSQAAKQQRAADILLAQSQSTEPLRATCGGNVDAIREGARNRVLPAD